MPIVLESTLPVITIELVRSPSPTSSAVAPGSVKVLPTSIVSGLSPSMVITGAVVSTTLTVRVTETAALPLVSLTS